MSRMITTALVVGACSLALAASDPLALVNVKMSKFLRGGDPQVRTLASKRVPAVDKNGKQLVDPDGRPLTGIPLLDPHGNPLRNMYGSQTWVTDGDVAVIWGGRGPKGLVFAWSHWDEKVATKAQEEAKAARKAAQQATGPQKVTLSARANALSARAAALAKKPHEPSGFVRLEDLDPRDFVKKGPGYSFSIAKLPTRWTKVCGTNGSPVAATGQSVALAPRQIEKSLTVAAQSSANKKKEFSFWTYGSYMGNESWAFLCWNLPNLPGGGSERAIVARGDTFTLCKVTPQKFRCRGGSVTFVYGFFEYGGERFYGWTVAEHEFAGKTTPHMSPALKLPTPRVIASVRGDAP